jgi:uncharacterized coiled-coil protein SlyX
MTKPSDLYGEDIRLWSETQGDLLRRVAAGEAVADQVDWPHVIRQIENLGCDEVQHRDRQQEITELAARLAAAEALVEELRARLEAITGKVANTQAELAAQLQAEGTADGGFLAVEREQAIRMAEIAPKERGLIARLRAAWLGE